MNDESADDLDPTEIDLTPLVKYMRRHNLSSVKLRIEAADEPAGSTVTLAGERRPLVDNAIPSDLGLEGVFFVAST